MRQGLKFIALAGLAGIVPVTANAAIFTIALTGVVANFTQSSYDAGNLHFDNHSLSLRDLTPDNPVTVAMGDTINSTVTLDALYTIPASSVRTDFLHYFSGGGFPTENTGVSGTFQFFNGATLVQTIGYSSTTSSQLASFGILFPPANTAFTFDSFTNNFVIDTLATPATLDGSSLSYSLVSSNVPDAPIWALMISGFGMIGTVLRKRSLVQTA